MNSENLKSKLESLKKISHPPQPENSLLNDPIYWKTRDTLHQIYKNLYLTSAQKAKDIDVLKKEGITHIFIPAVICNDLDIFHPNDFEYKQLPIRDEKDQNISQYFNEIFDWMDEILENPDNKLLVHCKAGASRSASFVIGYLMKKTQKDYWTVREEVREIRSVIDPISNFEKQLIDFQY